MTNPTFVVHRAPNNACGEWARGIEDSGAFYGSIQFRTRREAAADAAAMNVVLEANPRVANELRKLTTCRGFSVCRRP